MKRCPQCNLEYFDEMLEFCLEDGMKLTLISNPANEMPTVTRTNKPRLTINDPVDSPLTGIAETLETNVSNKSETPFPAEAVNAKPLRDKVTTQSYKVLEVAPIVFSLTHNWWQWVYLNNQYYTSFSSYVFSANFLVWLLLLAASAVVGLLAIKLCRNKGFAYTSLVILAINLLLFLVPKR